MMSDDGPGFFHLPLRPLSRRRGESGETRPAEAEQEAIHEIVLLRHKSAESPR